MSALSPGAVLGGRYRMDKRIAGGGMGEVWCGHDEVLGRTVAVKVMLSALTEEPGFAERFHGEARTMATVNHAGVVKIYDYGSHEGTAYLVMEYVEGDALSTTLNRVGRLTPARTMALVAQAADALHAAHDKGIVHRDVKPANLLVRPDGTLVLTDFGIARSELSGQLTAVGSVLGTAAYISPEQASGKPASPRSDLYALGVVAYQCLSGRRPFEGDNPLSLAMRHLNDTPPPLPQDIPVAVRQVVERSMVKDPAARWESAKAFANAARRAAAQPGTPLSMPGVPGQPGPGGPAGTRVLPQPGGNRPVSGPGQNRPVSPPPGVRLGATGHGPAGAVPGRPVPAVGGAGMAGHGGPGPGGPGAGRFAPGAAAIPAATQTRIGGHPYPPTQTGYPAGSPAPGYAPGAPRPMIAPPPSAPPRSGNTAVYVVLAVALVLLLCVGGWVLSRGGGNKDRGVVAPATSTSTRYSPTPKKTTATTTKPVPKGTSIDCKALRNKPVNLVRAQLILEGYEIEEKTAPDDNVDKGDVIALDPCTGLQDGDTVTLTVSTGPAKSSPSSTPDCDMVACPSSTRP